MPTSRLVTVVYDGPHPVWAQVGVLKMGQPATYVLNTLCSLDVMDSPNFLTSRPGDYVPELRDLNQDWELEPGRCYIAVGRVEWSHRAFHWRGSPVCSAARRLLRMPGVGEPVRIEGFTVESVWEVYLK